LFLDFRQAFLINAVSSKALTKIQAPGELQLSVGLLFAHQKIPLGAPQA
jgi:hypothetical protein